MEEKESKKKVISKKNNVKNIDIEEKESKKKVTSKKNNAKNIDIEEKEPKKDVISKKNNVKNIDIEEKESKKKVTSKKNNAKNIDIEEKEPKKDVTSKKNNAKNIDIEEKETKKNVASKKNNAKNIDIEEIIKKATESTRAKTQKAVEDKQKEMDLKAFDDNKSKEKHSGWLSKLFVGAFVVLSAGAGFTGGFFMQKSNADKLKNDNNKLKIELEQEKDQNEEYYEDYLNAYNTLQNKLAEITTLETAKKALEDELTSKKAELNASNASLTIKENQLASLNTEKLALEQERNTLLGSVNSVLDIVEDLNLDSTKDKERDEINIADAVDEMLEIKESQDVTIENLQGKLDAVLNVVENIPLESTTGKTREEINLVDVVNEMLEIKESQDERISELEADIDKLEQDVDNLTTINHEYNAEIVRLNNLLSEKEAELAEKESKLELFLLINQSETTSASKFAITDGEITGYIGDDADTVETIVLPSTYSLDENDNVIDGNENVITSVGADAFANLPNVKFIKISDNVVTFKANLSSCTNLNTIYFGNNITNYTTNFSGLTIENVFVPSVEKWLKISFASSSNNPLLAANNAYFNYEKVVDLVIPEGIDKTLPYAFYGAKFLNSISLPTSLTSIGNFSFYNCTNVTEINFSEGLQTIGQLSFYGCASLSQIEFPSTLKTIEHGAFQNCGNLSGELVLNEGLEYLGAGAFSLLTLGGTPLNNYLTSIVIPQSLTTIGAPSMMVGSPIDRRSNMIVKISDLNSWLNVNFEVYGGIFGSGHDIANPLETEGATLYLNNQPITQLDFNQFPEILSFSSEAFSGYDKLESINFGNVQDIGSYAFSGCSGLANIDLANVQSIGSYAFSGCSGLVEINLANVESIGDGAFRSCSNLANINLANVESIGSNAFNSCSSLEYINFANVKTIGERAFSSCSNLANIDLANVQSIGSYAFNSCSSLEYINFANVKTIGENAFLSCGLVDIDLANVEYIGAGAFQGCSYLSYVYIPISVTTITTGYNAYPFATGMLNMIIECAAESKPDGWSDGWNSVGHNDPSSYSVTWGVAAKRQ